MVVLLELHLQLGIVEYLSRHVLDVGSLVCFLYVYHTDSLWCENLGEASREGDEDYGVGDPGQVLKEHVAVQAPIHPLLCCGDTHTHTKRRRENHNWMAGKVFKKRNMEFVCILITGRK